MATEQVSRRPEDTKKKGRSVRDRLALLTGQSARKKGEHPMDLVLYRNCSNVTQVLYDEQGQKQVLQPATFTGKSISIAEKKRDPEALVKFTGGTITLTRARGTPLVAMGKLAEVKVEDAAVEGDYEAD